MDYDKLIEDMREIAGKNSISLYKRGRCADAATAIETSWHENQALRGLINGLNAELSHVRADLARVTAERDMALTDLNKLRLTSGWQCYACDNADAPEGNSRCNGCNYREGNNYKWRGIQT